MTMQQLSERICQAYEIEHHAGIPIYHDKFIVEDWSRLMPLAVENDIGIDIDVAGIVYALPYGISPIFETFDYNDDPKVLAANKLLALSIAIARALIAIKE